MISNILDRLLHRSPKTEYPDAKWIDALIESKMDVDGLFNVAVVCNIRNNLIEAIIKTFNIVIGGDDRFVNLQTVKDDLRKRNNALYSYNHEALKFIMIANNYQFNKKYAKAVILNELLLYKSLWYSDISRDRVDDFCKVMSGFFNTEFVDGMKGLTDLMLAEIMRLADRKYGKLRIALPDIPKLAKPEFPPGRFVKY